ncbi:MAG: mevalonate kinase [Rhodothermaceae bacterium]
MVITKIESSAPGRVCLFGEHQDYLNLPVIPCAINLRVSISGETAEKSEVKLNLPDINDSESFILTDKLHYNRERDYYKSVINVLLKKGFTFSGGITAEVRGEIPINSGTSSSSALIVAWINFLTQTSDQSVTLKPEEVAELAFQAEVAEFNEPGGKMDHFSCAVGGLFFLDFQPEIKVKKYKGGLKTFVLGDSGEPKDTKGILSRVKNGVLSIVESLKSFEPGFEIRKCESDDLEKYRGILNQEQIELLKATVNNYKITLEADKLLSEENVDDKKIGDLLNKHHSILRDELKISTQKIDRMINAALEAGAYGAKINGSGGGGCMFAYAPENPKDVAEAIIKEGGRAFIVEPDSGVK